MAYLGNLLPHTAVVAKALSIYQVQIDIFLIRKDVRAARLTYLITEFEGHNMSPETW